MAKRFTAWTIKHGRWAFIDYIRKSKRDAIAAYVKDSRRPWKKLYAQGARAVRMNGTMP